MDIHSLIHSKSRKTVTRSDGEWADLDGFSTHHNHIRFGKNNAGEIIWDMFEAPLLLVIVGIMSAATSCLCNTLIDFGNSIRYNILTSTTDYFAWILYCSWCLAFSLLACFVTSTICQDAAGSGLPEMKTILSGVVKPVLLSVRLIFAKMLGLTFSMIAGLSVGKEGPFVQISGAIADQLMRLSIFRHIRAQDSKRLEIIACACASGVGATFGTAFGGVIFSIELTTSAYLVRTVPKAFLSSVCAMLTIYYLNVSDQLALFNDETTFKTQSNVASWQEMSTFLGIGLATGLLGVIFVTFVEQISKFRNKMLDLTKFSKSTVASRRYVMVALVSLIVSIPLYYELVTVPEVSNGSKSLLDHLFQANDMGHILGKLVVYFAYKFAATALSVTLPLPVGLFTPVFLSGGVLGRVVGEILYSNSSFKNFLPWEYAILGAAGFATGVTRAISTAIIVYELSGQPRMRLPLAVVVLTSYFVGNRFSKNVYEALIDTNGTPYMQEIPKQLYNIPVAKVMIPLEQQHVLALDSTYADANVLLQSIDESELQRKSSTLNIELTSKSDGATSSYHDGAYHALDASSVLSVTQPIFSAGQHQLKHYSPSVIPIVKSKQSMVIVGAIRREDLARVLSCLKDILTISRRPPIVLGASAKGSNIELFNLENGRSQVPPEFDHRTAQAQRHVSFQSDPVLKEKIQYVVLEDGGKSVVPVASCSADCNVSILKSFSLAVVLDPSPYQIVDTMQLSKVDLLFRMLSLSQAYVTNSGKLVGFVTRSALREYLGKHHRKPIDKCRQLNTALWHTLCCIGSERYESIPEEESL